MLYYIDYQIIMIICNFIQSYELILENLRKLIISDNA